MASYITLPPTALSFRVNFGDPLTDAGNSWLFVTPGCTELCVGGDRMKSLRLYEGSSVSLSRWTKLALAALVAAVGWLNEGVPVMGQSTTATLSGVVRD